MEDKKDKKREKVDKIRRKLLKIGVWSVPVIIAFTSRKLWAGTPGLPGGKKRRELFEEEREF